MNTNLPIWRFKKFIWSLFHWPKYKVGDKLINIRGGKDIVIKKRFISPYIPGSNYSWSYKYSDGFTIGDSGLDMNYKKEKLCL